jgi:hypothetical protein
MGEMRNAYKVLVGKREEERPLRKPRSKLEDNIKINLNERGWEDVDWIHLALDQWCALVNMVMNLLVP